MKEQVEREIELRRHRKTLTVLGAGVIAFGFWNLMKSFMTTLEDPAGFLENGDPKDGLIALTVSVGSILLFMGADLLLRIWVGRAAIKTGRGTAKKELRLTGFIVLAILNVLAILMDAAFLVLSILFSGGDWEIIIRIPDIAVTLIGDLTGFLILVQLIYAAVHVRKLTKEQYAD